MSSPVAAGSPTRVAHDAPERLTYPRALEIIGTGAYHWKLLALCGWVNASDAVEILAVSFILPSATDDLRLTSSDKGWLGAVIFIGMMLGGWIWGTVADRIGRRQCLIISLVVNSAAGFLSAFAPTFWWLMILRFFAGLGVGGSIPVVWSYFAEFLPLQSRGSFMVYMAMFWMLGSGLIGGLAWLIIPSSMAFPLAGMNFNSWRIFSFLCGIPALSSVITLLPAHESPRWLLSQGNLKECIAILKLMNRANKSGKWCGTPPEVSTEEDAVFDDLAPEVLASLDDEEIQEEEKVSLISKPTKPTTIPKPTPEPLPLDTHHLARLTSSASPTDVSGATWAPHREAPGALSPGSMSSPALATRFTEAIDVDQLSPKGHRIADGPELDSSGEPLPQPKITFRGWVRASCRSIQLGWQKNMSLFRPTYRRSSTLCAIIFFGLSFGYYGLTMFLPQYFTDMDGAVDVYLSSFLGALSNAPGNIIAVWSVKALGRGKTLAFSLWLSSLVMFGVLLVDDGYEVVILMCVFSGISIAAWNSTNIIVTELFPTRIRSTAFGFFAGLGRMGAIFGNLAFGEFGAAAPTVPIICVAICLTIAGIASLLLPDTRLSVLS